MENGLVFRAARRGEEKAVLALYRTAIGTAFCTWNDEYPGMPEIEEGLEYDCLFVLETEGKIIGAISIAPENELDGLDCWRAGGKAGEFARVVIHPAYQGRHLARVLVENVLAVMESRGYENVHIAVEVANIPAQKTYRAMGFETVGQSELWGHRFWLCERKTK